MAARTWSGEGGESPLSEPGFELPLEGEGEMKDEKMLKGMSEKIYVLLDPFH